MFIYSKKLIIYIREMEVSFVADFHASDPYSKRYEGCEGNLLTPSPTPIKCDNLSCRVVVVIVMLSLNAMSLLG